MKQSAQNFSCAVEARFMGRSTASFFNARKRASLKKALAKGYFS